MRTLLIPSLLSAGLAALCCAASVAHAETAAPAAPSVERYAVRADFRGAALDVGYSEQARRSASCLATYGRAYDLHTGQVRLTTGAMRPCLL